MNTEQNFNSALHPAISTMEAVYNMGMQGIACEIDKEYFEAGKKRIESLPPRQAVLFE